VPVPTKQAFQRNERGRFAGKELAPLHRTWTNLRCWNDKKGTISVREMEGFLPRLLCRRWASVEHVVLSVAFGLPLPRPAFRNREGFSHLCLEN
jgi:hypothetical protein